MKKVLLSIIFIFSVATLFAQKTPTFTWHSISAKDDKNTYDRILVGSTESALFFAEEKLNLKKSIRKGVRQVSSYDLVVYDRKTLKLLSRKTLELKEDGKRLGLYDVKIVKDGTIWLFSRYWDKAKRKYFLYAESFNTSSKKGNANRRLVAERPDDLPMFAFDWANPKFVVSTSFDKSKVLIIHQFNVGKNEKAKVHLAVFDTKMNQLWDKEVTLSSIRKDTKIGDIGVDNDGNVFFVASMKLKKAKRGEVSSEQKLFVYTKKGEVSTSKKVRLGSNKWVSDNGVVWAVEGGKLLYFVSYANGRKSGDIGFLVARYDMATGTIDQTKKYKFPLKWVTLGSAKNLSSIKKTIEKNRFKFHKDLILKNLTYNKADASSVVFLENYKKGSYGGAESSTVMHEFKEAIIIRIDKNGEMVWQDAVRKWQREFSFDSGSYLPYVSEGTAHLLVSELKVNTKNRKDNMKLSKPSLLAGFSKLETILVTIDSNGKKMEKVLDVKPSSIVFSDEFFKLSDSEYVVFGIIKNSGERGKQAIGLMKF